jgi:crotonobetainyl-CoA:carnitine CoA-transferase CaiB-like acyl-CoA transferase
VAEAVNELDQAGIPSGPVNSIAQVAKDPHLKAREMILEVEHPVMGILPLLGFPVKLSATPGTVRLPPATLGQHNQEVYRELLGMTEEELAALRQEGVI